MKLHRSPSSSHTIFSGSGQYRSYHPPFSSRTPKIVWCTLHRSSRTMLRTTSLKGLWKNAQNQDMLFGIVVLLILAQNVSNLLVKMLRCKWLQCKRLNNIRATYLIKFTNIEIPNNFFNVLP